MLHLRSLALRELPEPRRGFPFNLAVLRSFPVLEFTAPVSFLVGENGSGKSTFLEALALAIGSISVGSAEIGRDNSLSAVKKLSLYYKLTWNKRTHKGFFLRAEDFFGYARRMGQIRQELEQDLKAVDDEYRGRSETAREYARMPYQNEIGALQRRYGDGLDSQSHGESFLALFQARFVPGGLYLLDEPEAPLSPLRQLSLISLLKQMVAANGQFIIATHSPILMAFPGATIWSFDGGALHPASYEQLDHVTLTRSFLNNPDSYLQHL